MEDIRKWQQQVKIARYMLLGTVIATVVNLALMLAGSELYIVYSAAVAYYLGWFGWVFDGGVAGQLTAIGMGLAAVVLAVYLLVWYFAGSRVFWLKVGLGLVATDAAALLALVLWMGGGLMSFFWEFALHGAVIYEIYVGIAAQKKLAMLPQPETAEQYV